MMEVLAGQNPTRAQGIRAALHTLMD